MATAGVFVSLLVVLVVPKSCLSAHSASPTPYVFDYTVGTGRRFDGIGAISGGGATSKLLVNYPEQQRNDVLDYLFKPKFGASLQILKVEIGGDSQSSEGTESSHMHHEWDENYSRGYEWWLMTEAKKRNPSIRIYGLPWGYPSWVGGGEWWPYRYPNRTATYIIKWIQGAKTHYNVTVDYVGIWNEKPYDSTYIKTLKWRLAHAGLSHVQIVAADGIGSNSWDIARDMKTDPELMKAVDILGGHYVGTSTSPEARGIGKPLWSSEDYSAEAGDYGAACIARLLNQNYVNGELTGFIAWNLITSYYDNLPYRRHSLMIAQEPWSGHYEVTGPVWTTAHTTQFTELGWSYLRNGTGAGFLRGGGSYVSLVSPDKKDFTIVIETTNGLNTGICLNIPMHPYPVAAQNVSFILKGPLGKLSQLHMWKSEMDYKGGQSSYFKYIGVVKVQDGVVSLSLGLDQVITLTTISKGVKGSHGVPPKPAPFPLPYTDDFEKYTESSEAYNLAAQVGVFEVHPALGSGRSAHGQRSARGQVLRQVITAPPIHWCPFVQVSPLTVGGNYNWSDVTVTVDVHIPPVNGSSGTFVAARVDQGGCTTFVAKGVFMFLDAGNQLVELALDLERTLSVKKVNFVLDPDTWYTVSLTVKGNTAVGTVAGQSVFKETFKPSSPHGFIGLGTLDFGLAQFDNLQVKPS